MLVMKKENKKLLEEVIKDRLTKSLGSDPDEASEALKEAMEAIDRQTVLDKDDKDRIVKFVEIGTAVVLAPLIEAGCKKAFAHMICEFERNDSFTTMAGKSLSGLFKFRK
jgi:uncharacterized protein YpuA (DUF1002 family)